MLGECYRKMASKQFREQMQARLNEPHIAPITALVDRLRDHDGRGWMPYVAPSYGGVNARVLFLFQDPGPATQNDVGSGMLCHENDDPTAALFAECLDKVGIPASLVMTWNAYPWYVNRTPTARERTEALPALLQLLGLLRSLQVVVPCGRVAQDSWRRFTRVHPETSKRYHEIASLHTSRRGITAGGKLTREAGIDKVMTDYIKIATLSGVQSSG